MGFTDLRVVAPRDPGYRRHPDAVALATSSADVLEASRDYPDLLSALEGVGLAFALSGYSREFGPPLEDLRTSVARAAAWFGSGCAAPGAKAAFVFGTERSGLTNAQMDLCGACTAIVANPASTSLNLAQAVQITAYEMQLALLSGHEHELYAWQDRFGGAVTAPPAAIEGFFRHWEQAMIACGALDPAEPKNLMGMTRRLIARAGLTQSEVDLLRGICAAVIRSKRDRAGSKKPAPPRS
ncbi:MAG: RNA methyltransferase [Duodenibacillus sp.]|nr:RNA methyltransferase [Duodenibacillus sp.]